MLNLGTVNGVRVTSAARVAWKSDDDDAVRVRCESRGLVLFDGGGKSDAIVVGSHAVIWERQGERFRAFALPRESAVIELRSLALMMRALASDLYDSDHDTSALLLNLVGLVNTHIAVKELAK